MPVGADREEKNMLRELVLHSGGLEVSSENGGFVTHWMVLAEECTKGERTRKECIGTPGRVMDVEKHLQSKESHSKAGEELHYDADMDGLVREWRAEFRATSQFNIWTLRKWTWARRASCISRWSRGCAPT